MDFQWIYLAYFLHIGKIAETVWPGMIVVFAYFSKSSHIDVSFRILICENAYTWKPCKYSVLLPNLQLFGAHHTVEFLVVVVRWRKEARYTPVLAST